ncbi:hypothetical protein COY17_02010 [Candidatus Saccharibacteria bacterium CG_4_10_14_0_2_um_filter_52_9]|nr:MAG: hypothetical protein COY17_02010 [Candidatus Saccharibacteria bacterium CG_4_10_14_0_2_um_filter_52_9]
MAAPAISGEAGLQELQRFAELGRLSASLLHEISNPLTAALLHLDQFSDQTSPAIKQVRRNIYALRRYVEAARQQVRQESRLSAFAITPQFEQLKQVVRPLARKAAVQLVFETIPSCRLYGDPVKFQQLLANLIINAIDAYEDDLCSGLARPVRVRVSRTPHYLTIKVIDWGKGITADQLSQLFKPFYTTKTRAAYGLGIGLTIVERFVTVDFDGSITVTSSRRHGTQFTIRFPLH